MVPGVVGRLAAGATVLATPATVRRALDLLLGSALLAQATLTPLPARATASAPPVAAGLAHPTAASLPAWAAAPPPPVAARPAHPSVAPLPARAAAPPPPVAAGAAWTRTGLDRSGAPAPLPPWLAERSAAAGGGRVSAGGSGSAGRGAGARQRRTGRPPATVEAEGVRGAGVVGTHTVRPGDTLWAIAAAHLPPTWRSPATIDRYWRQVYGANRSVVGPDPDLIHPGTRLLVPPYRPDHR